MEKFSQRFHCTHFVLGTQLPGLDPQKVTRAWELFAQEVLPTFRD